MPAASSTWLPGWERLTPSHEVIPEEGDPEPQVQHHQVGADAGEELREASALSAQVDKDSGGQDPVGVDARKVVPGGVQLSSLDQLWGHNLVSQSWTCIPTLTLALSGVTLGTSLPISEPPVLRKIEMRCVKAPGASPGAGCVQTRSWLWTNCFPPSFSFVKWGHLALSPLPPRAAEKFRSEGTLQ